jgi:hypothetical protein
VQQVLTKCPADSFCKLPGMAAGKDVDACGVYYPDHIGIS